MADAPKPAPKSEPIEIKIAEVLSNGTAVLTLPDGRMFHAEVPEGLAVRKHAKVEIKSEGEDSEGVPLKAVLTRLV